MRTLLLATLLPLCLTACLQSTPPTLEQSANTEQEKAMPTIASNTLLNHMPEKQNMAEKLSDTHSALVSLDDIKTAKDALNLLIIDKHCQTNMQCKVSAVGSRACGGPSEYVVYSTHTASEQDVTVRSKKITLLESNYNAQNNMMSICQHLTAPSTQCVENKCVKLKDSALSVF